MTSSSFFSIELQSTEGVEYRRDFGSFELPASAGSELVLEATCEFSILIRRATADKRLRVLIGSERIGELAVGRTHRQFDRQAWFWNEFGSGCIRVLRQVGFGLADFEQLFELPIRIIPRQSVLRDYRVMMGDLQRIHEGLAHDVLGRTSHRHGISPDKVNTLRPDAVLQAIENIRLQLKRSLDAIAKQPSTGLVRQTVVSNYRGGQRIDAASLQALVYDQQTAIDASGRIQSLGRVRIRRPAITRDIAEHRQIAQALRDLAKRALLIGDHCRKSIELLEIEKHQWGKVRGEGGLSVFEQRDLPRIERLKQVADDSPILAANLQDLLQSHEFLVQAGSPRTPLGPTPLFLGRPAYRDVYETLLDAKRPLGILVDGDALKIAYRDLATTYEYWCFMKVVEHLRGRFGQPKPKAAYALIDDVYRPELTPGQSFRFEVGPNAEAVVSYTPEFFPAREARRRKMRFVATLTSSPLRPDVTIEFRRQGCKPVIIVLDAKSTERFSARQLRNVSDYSRQILELDTSYQPVRQVFLMHRGREQRPQVNIPGYLSGADIDRQSMVIGAFDCSPRRIGFTPHDLSLVIDRFLYFCSES